MDHAQAYTWDADSSPLRKNNPGRDQILQPLLHRRDQTRGEERCAQNCIWPRVASVLLNFLMFKWKLCGCERQIRTSIKISDGAFLFPVSQRKGNLIIYGKTKKNQSSPIRGQKIPQRLVLENCAKSMFYQTNREQPTGDDLYMESIWLLQCPMANRWRGKAGRRLSFIIYLAY